MLRALESWFLVSVGLAAFATLVLVVPHPYQLTRQVDGGQVDWLQKVMIGCYSMALYFALCAPFAAGLAILRAIVARWMGSSSIAFTAGVRRLRRVSLALGCLPLAAAAVGFAYETSRNELVLGEAASSTALDMNIVLIVIDTLRADHLGCYGYPLDTTPFLDSLAAGAVRFERCHTAASWTKPSVASILTSLYPGTHGANHFQRRLPTEARTLAELMREAGFLTYANVTNVNLKAIFDFDQGFDFFDDYLLRDRLYLAALRELPLVSKRLRGFTGRRFNYRDRDSAAVANARILPWLERYQDQSFFMYLHYMEPHTPYSAPASYAARFARGTSPIDQALAGYDGDIRFLDDHLALLFARFKELGIFDKTLFVVTSDHGEAFGEHGDFGHDRTVYQELIGVPLIVAFGQELPSGLVIDTPVRSIDIAPTLLDFAGAETPDRMEGESLRGLMTGEQVPAAPADIFVDHYSARNRGRLSSVIRAGRWKYILTVKSEVRDIDRLGREELYDLEADPAETTNLAGSQKAILSELRDSCAGFSVRSKAVAFEPSDLEQLDSDTLQQLRELGYL